MAPQDPIPIRDPMDNALKHLIDTWLDLDKVPSQRILSASQSERLLHRMRIHGGKSSHYSKLEK
jgi:hypothetical protein